MDISIVDLLIDLVKTTCVIVVSAYILTRTKLFSNLLDKSVSPGNYIILILGFGLLSIFGTYGGITLPSGAIANIRDIGPMIGGLVGGPVVGLGAGIIGGIHRYLVGGFVGVPCALATIGAGLAGGIIYMTRKGRFVTTWQAAIAAILIELMHMGLVLLISRPYAEALALVKEVVVPMTVANALGAAIFMVIVNNLVTERKTSAEKEKYRHELDRREYEAETARDIQQSLLPEQTPIIKGYDFAAFSLPAWEVGGDYYDFIHLDGKKLGLVIADVSGKGFPAALFMALSRTCIRANITSDKSTSKAIEAANTILCQDAKSGMFMTLFYAVLNVDTNCLSYVNAGHNPPLLVRGKTGEVLTLQAKGIALGVVDGMNLDEKEINIEPDDIVILYTDGLTEAVNKNDEQFGVDRLTKTVKNSLHLNVNDLVEKVKADVDEFTAGKPRFDDLTLVAIKKQAIIQTEK
jgi:phosphoserine phosphatase RsbU/P